MYHYRKTAAQHLNKVTLPAGWEVPLAQGKRYIQPFDFQECGTREDGVLAISGESDRGRTVRYNSGSSACTGRE